MGKVFSFKEKLFKVKKIFSPAPMVSFRSSRKARSYLVRAKLFPLDRFIGSSRCAKKCCDVCVNNSRMDTFTSTITGETYKVNHKFNCDDKYLIYQLTWNHFRKQFDGETTDNFRCRWNNPTVRLLERKLVCKNNY